MFTNQQQEKSSGQFLFERFNERCWGLKENGNVSGGGTDDSPVVGTDENLPEKTQDLATVMATSNE